MNLLKKPTLGIFLLILLSSSPAKADTSNDALMNVTIWGAVLSLGMACYHDHAPCTASPQIDTDKLTISIDNGADESIKHTRLAIGADWETPFYESKNFLIDGRWEANINHWYSTDLNPANDSGWMFGVTPVFHYNWKASPKITPFLELGGGPQLLSDVTIEDEFKSTLFQFGSIFGLGVKSDTIEISYRYLHISNANIELPNPGTDFHNVHIGYKF